MVAQTHSSAETVNSLQKEPNISQVISVKKKEFI